MDITTPQEYRKNITKEKPIQLPSGLKCVIRGMPPLKMLQFTAEAQASGGELEDYIRKHMVDVLLSVLPSSVVSPMILPPLKLGDVKNEDALYLDELSMGDLVDLLAKIVEISGIDKEKLDGFDKFPDGRNRNGDSPSSQGVQL